MRQLFVFGLAAGAALLTAGCHRQPAATGTAASDAAVQQIAWREGDVDDAFAEAKESHKPVLLYWGAKWCPPCNLMKQTLFKDPAFIAQTRNFVPVHLDGDAKGAQLWGEKFGISGYPTVIVLGPDRREITRLSGSSAASSLTSVLKVAVSRTSSTEDLIARTADPSKLSADDWALLANFDWYDDPKHFGDNAKTAALLDRLASAAPDPAMRRHFALVGLFAGQSGGDVAKLTPAQLTQVRTILPAILASYDEVKANRQELSYGTVPLIRALPDAAERTRLGGQLTAALDRLAADDSIPLGDRLGTAEGEIALSKSENGGKIAPAILAKVRQRVALVDRAATDPMMRQAVMPNAGQLLDDAGDHAGGVKLLEGELPHAVAPYYFMVDLASMAEDRKDTKTAIGWLRKAAETAQGPATRIQWAIFYSDGVLRMTPQDKAAVEQSAGMVIDALGSNDSGYAQRTEKKVTDWAGKLKDWSRKNGGSAVIARLDTRLNAACAKAATGDACRKALATA